MKASGEQARRILLDALVVEQALYELRYEMNNRPAWMGMPLAGLRELIL